MPPTVTLRVPAPGSEVTQARPTLRFHYQDESGIDVSSVSMVLDGVPLSTTASAVGATGVLVRDLAPGAHRLEVAVADSVGNVARDAWSFTVRGASTSSSGLSPFSLVPIPVAGEASGVLSIATIRFAEGQERAPVILPLATAGVPAGVRALSVFDLAPALPGGGAAVLEFHLDPAWLSAAALDAGRLVLFHRVADVWQVHPLASVGTQEGRLVLIAEVDSFSPFALALDTQPPVLSIRMPSDVVAGDHIRVDVTVQDPSGVVPGILLLDGAPVDGVIRSASGLIGMLGPLEAGTHVITATATDLVGNEASETWSFVVAAIEGAGSLPGEPGPDDARGTMSPTPTSERDQQGATYSRALLAALVVAFVGLATLGHALTRGRTSGRRRR